METTVKQKTHSSLLQALSQSTQEKAKLFHLVDSLTLKEPDFSLETYLQIAFLILDAVEKSFIQDRGEDFFFWLIKHLASSQSSTQSQVYTLNHTVCYPFQSKEVLGIFLYFHEVILSNLPDLATLQKALIQKFSDIHLVEGSSFRLIQGRKPRMTLYFEVQKTKTSFTDKELTSLEILFLQTIRDDFKPFPPSVIVPSNRELLFKHFRAILDTLQEEDIPQVLIDFNQQVKETLYFSALVCQVKKQKAPSLKSRLQHPDIGIEGVMTFQEKNLLKEGMILSIQISSSTSLPVISGRIEAASLIQSLIGPFRDLNGGLLEKTMETFHLLEKAIKVPQESLKRFFHSITPQEAQATIPIPLLKTLYFSIKEQAGSYKKTNYQWEEIQEGICITLKTSNPHFEKAFRQFIYSHATSPVFSVDHTNAVTIIGCALKMKEGREHLLEEIQNFYCKWLEKKELKQVLKLSTNSDFSSLDPRIGTDEETSYLHNMLFEGLMRIGKEGAPEVAIAEKVERLDSGKRYRFFLKKSSWSNGLPLTAHDFVHSWRTSLLPHFLSPLSYLFFSIENGRAIKEGKVSTNQLGVQALDDLTLEVRLTHPAPYFLALCCLPVFSPVCSKIDQKTPSWPYSYGKTYSCNGPFTLESYYKGKELILKKNPFYWEEQKVRLEKILIAIHSPKESVEQLQAGQIDALLYPWCRQLPHKPPDMPVVKKIQGAPWICYLSLNCAKPPFHNQKIRQAFSLALDRHALARFYSDEATPTYSLYSPSFSQIEFHKEENGLLALKLLIEGLEEEGMQLQDIQEEALYVSQANESLVLLILKQLNSILHLKWKPLILDSSELLALSTLGHFAAKLYWWFNRVEDPNYFLEAFSSKESTGNYTFWIDRRLQNMIKKLRKETCQDKRNAFHKEVERFLNKQKPLIPLFYVPTYSLIQPNLCNIHSSPSEHFDLRHSYKI